MNTAPLIGKAAMKPDLAQAMPTAWPGGKGSPPRLRGVEAVIFDMDGLLLNTEILARRALQLAGADLGLELTDAFFALLIGVPADGNRRLLFEHYGSAAPADALFAAAARHQRTLIDSGEMQLKPGVLELLDQLDQAGLPHGVATSSGRDKALHHLQRAGIAERFQAIVTRDEVARGKPHPDLFLRAAQALGMAPGSCIALEDSYNGVRAAHAAAMPVIMVPDLLPPNDEMMGKCVTIVSDLHAVSAMLAMHSGVAKFAADTSPHGKSAASYIAAQP
ncbi:MAG: phosphatase [Polaromonas sp.]|nr:phosphatase [Polaromonas sp.]